MRNNYKLIFFSTLFLFAFFWCWEYFATSNSDFIFVLPPPSQIFWNIWHKSDRLLLHTQATLKEMLAGIGLAMLIAFPLAWIMYLWNSARAILQPIFVIIQCIPIFALAPIMVIWFDWSFTAILIPTTLMIFFPLTMNIYQGLKATPQAYMEYFQLNQATSLQTFYKLQLPFAFPHLCSGLRVSAGIAGIGAVAGEWAGAQVGLGVLMLESRRSAELSMTFAALFCLTFVSLILYSMTILIERSFIRPHQKSRTSSFSLKYGSAVLLIVLSILLGACQRPEDKKNTSKPPSRLILDWLPNPNHIPLYVGIEKGFFQQHGTPLILFKPFDVSDGFAYLTSKQSDMIVTYMPFIIRQKHKGAKIIPIGILIDQPLNSIIFRKNEGIKQPQDLSGKTIGYSANGVSKAFLQVLLNEHKIKPVNTLNTSFDLVTALAFKRVDAIYEAFWNIEPAQLSALGIESSFFTMQQFNVPHYHELIIVANEESTQSSDDFILNFKNALQKSIDYCRTNPEEAFEIYIKANPDKIEQTYSWEKNAWQNTLPVLAHQQELDLKLWEELYQWMLRQDLIN